MTPSGESAFPFLKQLLYGFYSVKTFCRGGHSRWFPMTTIPEAIYTNTYGEINISLKTIRSYSHGTLNSSLKNGILTSPLMTRTCKVGNNTLIGSSTQIHENAQVNASVIGRNCIIGSGTIIQNSYVFDGTIIGSHCVIERSIIGAGVNIKDHSRVERGSLIGDGVVVGPSVTLGPFERLSKKRDETDKDADEEDAEEDIDSDLEEVEASALF